MHLRDSATALAGIMDAAAGLSAAWPRSVEAREVARLSRQGYARGAVYEIEFSLAFDGAAAAAAALPAVLAAGFAVAGDGPTTPGFVTVRAPIRLRACALARAASRLNRIVSRHSGFAAVIGPVRGGEQEAPPADLRERVA